MYASDHALFRLGTYASAYLAGYDVDLNPLRIEAMRNVGEWVFLIPGPNGTKLVKSPNDWLYWLRSLGYQDAWIGPEAGRRSGLITRNAERRFLWSYKESTVSEEGHSWLRAQCAAELLPTFEERPHFDIPLLAETLREASTALRDFALSSDPTNEFTVWLDESIKILDRLLAGGNADALPEYLQSHFPPVGFTDAARLLGAAAFRGDVIGTGGMGSWDDRPYQDAEAAPSR